MTGDLFQGGLFEALLYPLKPGVSRGPPGLLRGQAPSGPSIIGPLGRTTERLRRESTNKVNEGKKARLNILRNKIFSLANIGKLSNVNVNFNPQ